MRRSLYIFLLFVLPLHAQKSSGYHFEHIGTDERFPHFLISSPVQDHFGFIWFVCGNNLIKYDGYKIQTFTSRKSNKDIILQNGRLHPMNDGSVWNVSSDMGYRYDPALESLEKVTFNDIFESGDNITSSYSDSASIWIGTRKGLVYRFDPVSRINTKIISFEKKGTYSSIGRMTKSLSGGIWVSTARKTYKIVNSCIADSISLSSICLCEDHSGNVYLFTYQGLVMRSKGSKKITSRGLEQLFGIMINAITEIRPNEIWIGTATHGIFIYRSNDNIMINLQHDEEDPHSLSSNLVYDIYKDRSDVVWIGTSMYLNKLDLHRKPFNDIARNWKDLKEQNKSFSAVLEDKAGLVWMITTDGKITIMEKSTGRFIKVTNQPLYSPRGLAFSQLCMDSLGFIWAMSWQMGVMKIYPPKQPLGSTTYLIGKHFSKYKDTTELAGWSYRTLFVNSKNELYLGAYDAGGIEKYNRINGRFNLIRIPGIRLWAMAAYPQDRLLLGTADDGLWVYYLKSQSNRYFKHSCKDNNSLTNDNIRCLLVSQDASVWVGTLDGLNRIDMKRNIITRFYTKDGLPNNSIVALQEDDKHNIWIATDNGCLLYTSRCV